MTKVISVPNQYYLHGDGTSISYYPEGFGPPVEGRGRVCLVYQNAYLSQVFYDSEVRTAVLDDLGTIVSVTLVMTVDVGSTTFSLLVPDVQLPGPDNSVFIRTEGITTVHTAFVEPMGRPPQDKTYTVAALTGTAVASPLPL